MSRPFDGRRDCLTDRCALKRAERSIPEGEPYRSGRGRRRVAAELVLIFDEIGHCVGEPPARPLAVAVVAWRRRRWRWSGRATAVVGVGAAGAAGWRRGGDCNGVEDDRWGVLASGRRFAVCDLHP